MLSQVKKIDDGVKHSAEISNVFIQREQHEKKQITETAHKVSHIKDVLSAQATFIAKVGQFKDNIQVACTTINRVIGSVKQHFEKEATSSEHASLHLLLDEAMVADRHIQQELMLIEKMESSSLEQSKKVEQELFDLNELLAEIAAVAGSAFVDKKKLHNTLEQIDVQMDKIKATIAEFEKITRNFTI